MEEIPYTHGCLQLYFAHWFAMVGRRTMDDSYWSRRRRDREYASKVPCLQVPGWHDREDIHGVFHHYKQAIAGRSADCQWLLLGPWCHTSCRFPSDEYSGR